MRSSHIATTFVRAALCALALTSPAAAGDGEQPTLLTDPALLSSLGFSPDAQNVYAFMNRLHQPIRASGEPTEYYGGTASGFTSYPGQAFNPVSNSSATNYGGCIGAEDLIFVSGDPQFRVQLDVPNGARLQSVRWWANDTHSTADLLFEVMQTCLPHLGPGPPTATVLATQSTLGSSGHQSGDIAVNTTVDMKACTYAIRVTFGVANCANTLYKVRAQWVRQVSNAPPTARFLDVPTNHPFFRFVEALAASGITGGCSPNQYCPDSPVTRGQMAVFLATALGVNWGGL